MQKEKVLVTGGNGFLALHIIKQLLTEGYSVRATLRSLQKKAGVLATLKAQRVPNLTQLEFFEADLTQDVDWQSAMADVTYVLSVAAPVFVAENSPTEELLQTATEGTLNILKAAIASNHVKRMVMTANLGAVGFSNKDPHHITTEADWTNPDEPGLSLYEKSKLVAEKKAWAYLKQHPTSLEFTTVNAGAILGHALDAHASGSFGLVRNLFNGQFQAVPNIQVNIINAVDVADIHVRAMKTPAAKNQRFLAVYDQPISMPEMVALIKQQRPQLAAKLPQKTLPSWLIKLLAPFNAQAKEGRLLLAVNHQVSNAKARKVLGWQPISTTEGAVLGAVDTLLQNGELD
ncbi:NAD-dependent epimerase/dehydratase family protein [Pediococcus siamensis]|uniref:NAD-dependent epimerase/dehydratase family protein n=1 Tax=Pediococcus siamensis TaxID=381829 RepID=UPI0039A31C67